MVLRFRRVSAHREIVRAGNVLFTVALAHRMCTNEGKTRSSLISWQRLGPSSSEALRGVEQPGTAGQTQRSRHQISKELWSRALLEVKQSKDQDAIKLIDEIGSRVGQDGTTDTCPTVMADLVMSISETMERQLKEKKSPTLASSYVEKTIDALNQFVSVGDVAVSYDPVHAALPWAVVRAVLVV
jgi:hypothetical protein